MKKYRDPIDAIINGGRWGPFHVTYPICVLNKDALVINGHTFIAIRDLTLKNEIEVCHAIEEQWLREELNNADNH